MALQGRLLCWVGYAGIFSLSDCARRWLYITFGSSILSESGSLVVSESQLSSWRVSVCDVKCLFHGKRRQRIAFCTFPFCRCQFCLSGGICNIVCPLLETELARIKVIKKRLQEVLCTRCSQCSSRSLGWGQKQ